ncbi:MAG: hypothetical protein ACE5GO_05200 [Anaerolineales bacterium]
MPNALAGEEINGAYVFTAEGMMMGPQAFYFERMPAIGWQPLGEGVGANQMLLTFQQGEERLSITVIYIPEQDLSLVTIILP